MIPTPGKHPLVKAYDSDLQIDVLEDHFRIKQVVAKAKYLEAAPKKAPPKKEKKDKKDKGKKDGKKDKTEGDGAILPFLWFPWPPQWLDTKHWSRGQERIGLPDISAKLCEWLVREQRSTKYGLRATQRHPMSLRLIDPLCHPKLAWTPMGQLGSAFATIRFSEARTSSHQI